MKSETTERAQKSPLGRLYRKVLSPKRKENKRSLPSSTVDLEDSRYCSNNNELQIVFDYFDENGDGKISAKELQSCVRMVGGELSTEDAETAVNSSDLNGDGLLDFVEFQKLMEGSSNREEDKKSELKQAFGMYAMEGRECITPASLKRMLSRLGESRSIHDCKAMIRVFDVNGDGVLTFDEFTLMMR